MAKQYQLTTTTSANASTVEATASPATVDDNRLRVVWSCEEHGRGVAVTIIPQDAYTQFVLHRVLVYATASRALPDDN